MRPGVRPPGGGPQAGREGRGADPDVHTRKIPLDPDVNLEVLAKGTPGFTGADLANLANEAAIHAAGDQPRHGHDGLLRDGQGQGDDGARAALDDHQRRGEEIHRLPRGGHAIVATLTPGADPIHKVSIIPRGMALGITQQLPIDERHTYSQVYLKNNITILMGGRVAEELVHGRTDHGRGERHRAGHGACTEDGLRMGDER